MSSDERILFPETNVGKYTIKPWSFGMLFDISELLGTVIDKAEDKRLLEEFNSSDGFLNYTTIAKIFSIAGPEVLEIIKRTIKAEEEEIRDLDMETGVKICLAIFEQNKKTILDSLKNVLSTPTPKEEDEGVQE